MHDAADGSEKLSCGMMPQRNEATTCVLNYCIHTCQACGSQLPHVSCTPPRRRRRVRRRRGAYVDSSSTYAFASQSRSPAALRFRHAAMDAHEPWLSVQLTLGCRDVGSRLRSMRLFVSQDAVVSTDTPSGVAACVLQHGAQISLDRSLAIQHAQHLCRTELPNTLILKLCAIRGRPSSANASKIDS